MDKMMNADYQGQAWPAKTVRGVYPPLFALWAAMASIIMMFGALTSAYIVRQAAGNWLEFRVPDVFFRQHGDYPAQQRDIAYQLLVVPERTSTCLLKVLLACSLVLGLAFVMLQYTGWSSLFDMGVTLDGNPGGSFFYVITGIHAAHVLGGIFALVVALVHATSLPFRPTEKRRRRFQLVLHYWHFVDALWVYLFFFLLIQ